LAGVRPILVVREFHAGGGAGGSSTAGLFTAAVLAVGVDSTTGGCDILPMEKDFPLTSVGNAITGGGGDDKVAAEASATLGGGEDTAGIGVSAALGGGL
jgi:hypothetical protein